MRRFFDFVDEHGPGFSALMRGGPAIGTTTAHAMIDGVRRAAYDQIMTSALDWSVVVIPSRDIDRLGLHVCNVSGMRRALAGLALYAIMALAAAATDDLQSLAAYRFIQGLGGAAGPILSRAIIRDVKEPHEAANALALMGALVGVAPLLAPIVGGALTEYGGWRATFVGMAVYALFALGVVWLAFPYLERMMADAAAQIEAKFSRAGQRL